MFCGEKVYNKHNYYVNFVINFPLTEHLPLHVFMTNLKYILLIELL